VIWHVVGVLDDICERPLWIIHRILVLQHPSADGHDGRENTHDGDSVEVSDDLEVQFVVDQSPDYEDTQERARNE